MSSLSNNVPSVSTPELARVTRSIKSVVWEISTLNQSSSLAAGSKMPLAKPLRLTSIASSLLLPSGTVCVCRV